MIVMVIGDHFPQNARIETIQRGIKRCQVKIDAASHPFLTHDSYIDCKDAITSLTREHIEEQILNDMSRLKGNIEEPVKEQVIAAVKSCETLKQQNATWILAALENSA
jgi:hypothetical protein